MSKIKCHCHDVITYCDLSSIEDDKLSVIASLMLGFSGEMSEREIKRIGEIIESYLNRKKAFDYVFLNCDACIQPEAELNAEIAWLRLRA